jgi:hypothetical protein
MDTARAEQVEAELDAMIGRRDTERRNTEGERLEEALWAESVRRYNACQEQDLRLAWCEHYRRMRAVHWGLGDEYDQKLSELENGYERRQHD